MTLTQDRRAELLAGCPLFKGIDADGLAKLAALATSVDFPAGHVIARQGVDKDEHAIETVQGMLPGMGTIVPFKVEMDSKAIGHSLGDLNLRGLTGVSVVAISRNGQRLVFPKAEEVLQAGDVLALTGSHDAVFAAHKLLGKSPTQSQAGYVT